VPPPAPLNRHAVTPVALGLAGLLPFLAAAAGTALLPVAAAGTAATAAAVYGGLILAFLGGVHWGRALNAASDAAVTWAVTPSLIAFFAAFLPLAWTLAILAGGFVLAGLVDWAVFSRIGPRWYVRLRIVLTAVVTVALATTSANAPNTRPLIDLHALASAL